MVAESISELLDLAEDACNAADRLDGSHGMRRQGVEKGGGTGPGHCANRSSSSAGRQTSDDQSNANKQTLHAKLSELRALIKELNASILQSIDAGDYERAANLRDQCDRLEEECNALTRRISGVDSGRSIPAGARSPLLVSIKTEPDAIEITDSEEEDDDPMAAPHLKLIHSQIRYLSRLPSDVILKANKMILSTLQKSSTLWCLPPSLRSLLYSILLPSIQHKDFAIRKEALLAIGLTCTMDLALTKQYLPLFYEAIKFDHRAIGVTAINCLVDVFILFGLQPFLTVAESLDSVQCEITDLVLLNAKQTSREASNSKENAHLPLRLLSPFLRFLNIEATDLCAASAVGLAKLFIFDRIISSQILSLLLLLWLHPFTANDPTLSQTLGVFFTDFACSRFERQACLANAVLPTLEGIISAPPSSPLAEVDSGRLENPHHDDLALKLCSGAVNSANPAQVRLYVRMLGRLRLSLNKPTLYRSLLQMVDILFKRVDRNSRLPLYRFKKNISACISASGLESSCDCLPEELSVSGSNSPDGRSSGVNSTPSTLSVESMMPSSQLEQWNFERSSIPHGQGRLTFHDPSSHPDWLLFPNDEGEEEDDDDTEMSTFKASAPAAPMPVQNTQCPSSSTTGITQSRKQAPSAVASRSQLPASVLFARPAPPARPRENPP
ncbi:hypothetical protein AAHC03_026377 [Spirometra sp. Aus1]